MKVDVERHELSRETTISITFSDREENSNGSVGGLVSAIIGSIKYIMESGRASVTISGDWAGLKDQYWR